MPFLIVFNITLLINPVSDTMIFIILHLSLVKSPAYVLYVAKFSLLYIILASLLMLL